MTSYFSSLSDPEVANLLHAGAVGVIPTDTVYGLVASATNPTAVARLYATKLRKSPPGTMISASADDLAELGFPEATLRRVQHLWPAPLSVVLDATNILPYLKQQRTSLPVRVPDQPVLSQLLAQTGPLMTTSANAPKQPTSTSIDMAKQYFGDSIDFYVDGGDLSGRPPSTIISINTDNTIELLRQGAVTTPSSI